MLSVVSRSECPSKACAVFIDSPDSASNVACVWRKECHETRGLSISSQAGARTRLYRFFELSGVPFGVVNTRSSNVVRIDRDLCASIVFWRDSLMGITRRLLRVFGE